MFVRPRETGTDERGGAGFGLLIWRGMFVRPRETGTDERGGAGFGLLIWRGMFVRPRETGTDERGGAGFGLLIWRGMFVRPRETGTDECGEAGFCFLIWSVWESMREWPAAKRGQESSQEKELRFRAQQEGAGLGRQSEKPVFVATGHWADLRRDSDIRRRNQREPSEARRNLHNRRWQWENAGLLTEDWAQEKIAALCRFKENFAPLPPRCAKET